MATTQKHSIETKGYESVYDTIITYKGKPDSKVRYTQNLYINKYPTQNCQVSSLGLIEVVALLNDDKEFMLHMMQTIKSETCAQIMIDVRTNRFKKVNEMFKPYAKKVFKRSYVSTNDSLMTMCLYAWKDNF